MSTQITCPHCKKDFALGEVEAEEFKKELQQKMIAYKKQKDVELQQKLVDFEKQKTVIQNEAFQKASSEMEVKLKAAQEEAKIKSMQLQDLQRK